MQLAKFIDNRFQEIRIAEFEAEKARAFSFTREAEMVALHDLRLIIKTLLKWLLIPRLLFIYFGVCIGIFRAPEPVLVALLEKQKAEDEKKKQKLGMQDIGKHKKNHLEQVLNPDQPA